MMPQPNEPWDEELLAGYVLGDLTPEEAAQVKQYLDTQPEMVAEVKALQATLSLLPLALPETSLSPRLSSDLAQAAQNIVTQVPEKAALSRRTPWRRWAVAVAGIGATGLTLGLGYDSYRLRNELSIAQTALKQQSAEIKLAQGSGNRLFVLKTASKAQTVSGSLVIAPKSQLVLLTLQNLNPLPSGQVYRLWALSHGKKMNCGDFNANSEGQVFLKMPLEDLLVHTPTVFVTVESSDANPYPKGKTVMFGSESI
jgi:Anti-sigma-K factor rskA